MESVNKAVFKTISKKYDFCSLCLDTINNLEECFHTLDEVHWNNENLDIFKIIEVVFGSTIQGKIVTECICEICTNTLLQCYNFIKTCKSNLEHLYNAVDSLSYCLENTIPDLDNYKSLYVSLDTKTYISEQFYDDRPAVTPKNASKRFQTISNPKIAKLKTLAPKKPIRKKRQLTTDMPTKDMMYDPNNWTKYQCKECHKIYPRSYNLRQHFVRVHAPKDFKCPQCPRSFGTIGLVNLHVSESHVPTQCQECGKKFNSLHGLKIHREKHNNKLYVCNKCGKTYLTKIMYKNHIENNLCNKPKKSKSEAVYQCEHCPKKFCTLGYLKCHLRFHHGNGKAHICQYCNKKFHARSSLLSHIVTHTKERNYCCEICGGRFASNETLKYHKRIHTGERPYVCEHCDAKFLSASRKLDHVRRHHLEPSIQCDECNVKVKTLSSLATHKKKHEADQAAVTNIPCF